MNEVPLYMVAMSVSLRTKCTFSLQHLAHAGVPVLFESMFGRFADTTRTQGVVEAHAPPSLRPVAARDRNLCSDISRVLTSRTSPCDTLLAATRPH